MKKICNIGFRRYNSSSNSQGIRKELPFWYYGNFYYKILALGIIAGIVGPLYYIIDSKSKISDLKTNAKFDK
jgi:hypothetical protein